MPNAMDNQVNDKFDRTFKYDSVGRMTANQFGNGQSVSPYTQSITYDAFSQMTSRVTRHWNSDNSYVASFTNGRKSVGVYDAAGNMLDSNGLVSNNTWQKTKVDASGRTTSTKTRYREIKNIHFNTYWTLENEVEQKYDGDGHPLKIINSQQVIDTPQPPPYTEIKYQIWSSILNDTLTELRETGSKSETKVFAGGAVIAKQYGNVTQGMVRWIHADPVTGSRQEVQKNGVGEDYLRTELEPLGQEVEAIEPIEDFPVGNTAASFSAESPEWLCQYAGKDYWNMPASCQRAVNENLDNSLITKSKKGNVKEIISITPRSNGSQQNGRSILSLRMTKSTTKLMVDDDDNISIGNVGSVEVRDSFDSEIPGFVGAEFGFLDDLGVAPSTSIASDEIAKRFKDAWKELENRLNNPDCAKLFGGFAKAKKTLQETKFEFEVLNGPRSVEDPVYVGAYTKDKTITINSQGAFASENGKLTGWEDHKEIPQSIQFYNEDGKIEAVGFSNDVTLAAFVLLHELGHRSKSFDKKNNKDADDPEKQARNNTKIVNACFKTKPTEAK